MAEPLVPPDPESAEWPAWQACTIALAQAKAALHDLRTGKTVVSVQYGERRVQYSQATIAALKEYIDELNNQCGVPVAAKTARTPFGVIW